ncbi:hypothetical protein PAMP_006003 [Pampus punctatissimus]
MRMSEFDSSSEEDEVGEEQLTPFHISCMRVTVSQQLFVSVVISLTEELQSQGVQDVFVFCTRGELAKYRVPSLLDVYQQQGFIVHHMPFPDGDVPELEQCCQILKELQVSLENHRRTVIHCYGGLGRSALIAACLLLQLSLTMTANKAIEILREHRGGGAIQTVKQYNFLHEFRERYTAYEESREISTERPVSR